MSSSTITPSGASTAVASSRSRVSAARECSPSMWMKRGRRPSSFASSSAGAMLRLSAFQVMRRSAGDAVPGAIGLEAVDDLGVRPVEQVDAERLLSRRQRMRERDEEAPLERADLGDWAGDAHLGLHAQQPAADGGGEARRHAGHARVAGLQIAVDGGDAGADGFAGLGCDGRGGHALSPLEESARDHRRSLGLSQGGRGKRNLSGNRRNASQRGRSPPSPPLFSHRPLIHCRLAGCRSAAGELHQFALAAQGTNTPCPSPSLSVSSSPSASRSSL